MVINYVSATSNWPHPSALAASSADHRATDVILKRSGACLFLLCTAQQMLACASESPAVTVDSDSGDVVPPSWHKQTEPGHWTS
jgi:hypothetical protein